MAERVNIRPLQPVDTPETAEVVTRRALSHQIRRSLGGARGSWGSTMGCVGGGCSERMSNWSLAGAGDEVPVRDQIGRLDLMS